MIEAQGARFPSPLWGGDRGGGSPEPKCSAIPPSLTLPHEGGGNVRSFPSLSLPHIVSKTRLRHDGGEDRCGAQGVRMEAAS